jgi:hypothetical protein
MFWFIGFLLLAIFGIAWTIEDAKKAKLKQEEDQFLHPSVLPDPTSHDTNSNIFDGWNRR